MRNLLLVASEDLAWPSVRAMLYAMSEVQVVGEALTAADALEALASRNPDVVIVPATLEGRSSLGLIRKLHQHSPDADIVVLGLRFHPEELPDLASAGVTAYLIWGDLGADVLEQCLKIAILGDVMVGSLQVGRAFFEAMRGRLHPIPTVRLTPRQRSVLQLLAEDLTDKEIATRLHISENTVASHVRKICASLGVRTRFSLAIATAMTGILQPS